MDIQVGDVVTLKKQHPCGSREWEVLRTASRADVRGVSSPMGRLQSPDYERTQTG